MSPAFLGLSAAALWGTADFFAKGVAEREGSEVALFWLYIVGLPIFCAAALLTDSAMPQASALGLWIVAGLLNALAYLLLYRGFRIGSLAVVSTTNAAWAAVTVLLSAVFLAEVPGPRGLTGVLCAVAGVVLVSHTGGGWSVRAPGFVEGLGAALFFGASFFVLKLPGAQGGVFTQAAVLRAVGLLVVAVVLWRQGQGFARFAARPPLFAFLDSAGFLCFVAGLAGGAAYIVAPLGSLLTPVAVALAAIFLRERLLAPQWAGFALVVAGAILLS